MPVPGNGIETVVAVATGRREPGLSLRPADHAHRQPVRVAQRKPKILRLEHLIGDLCAGVRVTAAGAGVDDEIAVVAIVLVPTRDDDRVRPLAAAAGDPVL